MKALISILTVVSISTPAMAGDTFNVFLHGKSCKRIKVSQNGYTDSDRTPRVDLVKSETHDISLSLTRTETKLDIVRSAEVLPSGLIGRRGISERIEMKNRLETAKNSKGETVLRADKTEKLRKDTVKASGWHGKVKTVTRVHTFFDRKRVELKDGKLSLKLYTGFNDIQKDSVYESHLSEVLACDVPADLFAKVNAFYAGVAKEDLRRKSIVVNHQLK